MRKTMNNVSSKPSWQDSVPVSNSAIIFKGGLFVFGFLALFFLWAFSFPIASAVVAQGKVISAGQNKMLQHLRGGVVRDILVKDGDRVEKGQTLVLLDAADEQAELTRLIARHDRLSALRARLETEQGGEGFETVFSGNGLKLRGGQKLAAGDGEGEKKRIVAEQRKEFDAGRKRLNAELDAITFQIETLKEQRVGFKSRLSGESKLLKFTEKEIAQIRPLTNKGYLAKTRLWDLEKRLLEQTASVGNLKAEIEATGQRIAENEARFAQLSEADQEQRSEELTNTIGELNEIKDQIVAARKAVKLTELRAPQSGTVVKLDAHTKGGVVQGGAIIAEIVPDNSDLEVEFKVALADVRSVHVGQKARVVITAFNRRTYDPIDAEISYVSADSTLEERTGETFFIARANLIADPEKDTGIAEVQTGMETEIYVLAKPQVFMTYALQPITDSFSKAFIETK